MAISSLFCVKGIYAIFIKLTSAHINNLTISQNTSYTVVHETMDLNGTTYTEYSRSSYSDAIIGTVVTPEVLTIQGFDAPATQTVTLNGYSPVTITYRYMRKQYTLTINNSNHVTTSTPSGTYYYGQEIHLVADADDGAGHSFVKWSNNQTNRDYTFTLTGNTTIEPIYSPSYTITYEPNNGDSQIIDHVVQTESLGSLPSVSYDDCSSSTGDFHTRGCTYVYKLVGWYTEPTFVNKVDETYVPTGDITLYAKWNKIYFANDGPVTCTGSNYIDSGITMFNQQNADKDFIVTFTVEQNNGYTDDRGNIFSDMKEGAEPYPGVTFFTNGNTSYTMNINKQGNKQKKNNTGYVTGQSVVIKKLNGIVYYSYNGGNDVRINDFSTYTNYFDNNALFCAGADASGNPYRYFKGVVSGMSVEIIDPMTYTLHFDANGGTGVMADQVFSLGRPTTINSNGYYLEDYVFANWNTQPDGSGTSYANNYNITSDLGNDGDVINLYAQWDLADRFFVHFDANGGTGTMANQKFLIGDSPRPLTQNAYTRANYEFRGWNTQPDGSGVHYDDMQSVSDLSIIDDDVVTLYAEWWKIQYNHPGNAVFDGTLSTFIDTGVNVFDSTNINKDFEIRFTYKSVDSDIFTYTQTQPTIFNVKDESNSMFPGFNIRFNSTNSTANMTPTYRWGQRQSQSAPNIATANAPITFIYKRKNGVITYEYSYTGYTSTPYTVVNQGAWTLNQPFATNVAFGGYFDGTNTPGRFFKGTLSDMIILMDD